MCIAAPARVLAVSDNVATVDYGGVETTCRLETLAEEVAVGDYVLIHTGFAIRRLSPEDGAETLKLFDELARSLAAAPATPEPEENPRRADSPVGEQSRLQPAPNAGAPPRTEARQNPAKSGSAVGDEEGS